MTRLTLEWHLRGIIEGTVDAVCVRQDIEPDEHLGGWKKTCKRYYADPHVEGNREQRAEADAGSYTTGFTQESGDFCDAYDVPARAALDSDDPVAFLDAVAHDPFRRHQERYDAARLLDRHIWPDPPDAGTLGRAEGLLGHADRPDVDTSEWLDAGMVAPQIGPKYFAMRCVSDDCTEGECLMDPDIACDEGRAVCMVCGTEQPEPAYP